MQCHLCGNDSILKISIIEGTEMQVCTECSKLGTTPRNIKQTSNKYFEDTEEYIVDNFSTLIKTARENRNMKMQDAAKKLAFKESLLHKFEKGSITPNIDEARRIERFYGLRLVEQGNNNSQINLASDAKDYTFADMINQQS